MVGNAHHIEVQLIADGQGQAWAAGVRDCSCQRRHQKVIEESSSVVLTREQEEEVKEASRRLALRVRLPQRRHRRVPLRAVRASASPSWRSTRACRSSTPSPRPSPASTSSSCSCTSPAGGRLEGEPPEPVGHAIEARLNAEDPAMGFAPTPGRVQVLDLASGPGVRVDRGIAAGDVIPPDFDSMVAKVIAYGRTREEAIARLRRALRESTVIIEDGTTNRAFLLAILERPEFKAGEVDIAWLDRLGVSGEMEADARRRRRAAAGRDRARRRRDRDRARELLRLRAPRPARGRRAGVARGRGPPPRPGLPHRRLPARSGPLPRRRRRQRRRGRGRAPERPRAPDHDRRHDAPHDDLPPGRRPAGRGPRRAAPHHPRRRRLRPQPGPVRGRRRSRSARATRWPRATSSRSSSR